MVRKIFKYLEPIWTGADDKISIRSCLALFFSWKLVENLDYAIQKWENGRDLGDVSSIFFTLAGLIAALLGITAWSNMTAKKIDSESSLPYNTIVTEEIAETRTTGKKQTDTTTTIINTDSNSINEPKEGDI